MGVLEDSATVVDIRLDEEPSENLLSGHLLKDLHLRDFPIRVRAGDPTCGDVIVPEIVSKFIRAAYGRGYTDALKDDKPMTEDVPMLTQPMLFLDPAKTVQRRS